jgi:dienelactone hydrolase
MSPRLLSLAVALVLATPGLAHSSPTAFDPSYEAKNYSKTLERQNIYSTPQYQQRLRAVGADNRLHALQVQATDPEREFVTDLCWSGEDGCAGDVRLYDWQAKGYGIVTPVLFTARNGATLSGHLWATKAGPAKRPGVVVTNGSVQANEQLYWFAAQALAKAGYVVMTFDPQGQGQSDTFGEGTDQQEGFPAQSDGRPFFDGTVDALDFFLSTAQHPYVPRKSCGTGTSHQAKQVSRVARGLNSASNPFASLLDPRRVGLAGHSYGAAGASYVAQADPRVKAVVAWDNLAGADPSGRESGCVDPAARKVVKITKPGLGLSADYFLPPTPNRSLPDPKSKSVSSLDYSAKGVDTGEIIVRGGTHYDFSFIPNPGFQASLRGEDLIAWYTVAWFDKYVKGDRTADARLLTDRWRYDGATAAVDPWGDGNLFSDYYDSRLDIRVAGRRVRCESLRTSCRALSSHDGINGTYDVIAVDTAPDGRPTTTMPAAAGIR